MNVLVANLLGIDPVSVAIAHGEDVGVPVFENSEAGYHACSRMKGDPHSVDYIRNSTGWIRISLREIVASKTIEEIQQICEFAPDDTKREALARYLELCTTAAQVAQCYLRILEEWSSYKTLELEALQKMALLLHDELRAIEPSAGDAEVTLADLPQDLLDLINDQADELVVSREEFFERMGTERINESRAIAMPSLRFTDQP